MPKPDEPNRQQSTALHLAAPAWERLALLVVVALVVFLLAGWCHRSNATTPVIIDELTYLWQAQALAQGRLSLPVPELSNLVSTPFLHERGAIRFGRYPIGFPLALAPWVRAGIPWGLNIMLGALSLLLMHRLARRLDGALLAWISTILLALSPFFVAQSTAFMSHPLTLVLSLGLLLSVRNWEENSGSPGKLVLAGACLGYLVNLSPFILFPLGFVLLDRLIANRRSVRFGATMIALAVPLAIGGAVYCAVNWRTTGDPLLPAYYLEEGQRAGFGDDVGRVGHTPADSVRNARDRLTLLNSMLFGWPLTSLWFAAAYLLLSAARGLRRGRWDRALLILFVSTEATYFFWYFSGANESLGPRYLYITMPALILFTARGIVAAGERASRAATRARLPARAGLASALLLAALMSAWGLPRELRQLAQAPHNRQRRATRAFLDELDREGIRTGTIFVESGRAAPLLYVSRFDEDAELVFARSGYATERRRLVEMRGGGPVYYAERDNETYAWRLVDEPRSRREPTQPRARSSNR